MKKPTLFLTLFVSAIIVNSSFVNKKPVLLNESVLLQQEIVDSIFFPVLGNLHSGTYEKEIIKSQDELKVLKQCQMGYCETGYRVVAYQALLIPIDGQPSALSVTGNSLISLKDMFERAKSKDRVIIAYFIAENAAGDQVNLSRKLILDIE